MTTRKSVAAAKTETDKLNKEVAELQKMGAQVQDAMAPEDQHALKSAHQLIDRKGFSWSRLLADLESFVPGDVFVKRIVVKDISQRSGPTVAELDLAVVGRSPQDVTRMVADMEGSRIFNAQPISSEAGRGEGVEWTLKVIYKPTTTAPVQSKNPNASIASTKTEPTESATPAPTTKGGETR
jgi:Tfp pilus assembly protein PilN